MAADSLGQLQSSLGSTSDFSCPSLEEFHNFKISDKTASMYMERRVSYFVLVGGRLLLESLATRLQHTVCCVMQQHATESGDCPCL